MRKFEDKRGRGRGNGSGRGRKGGGGWTGCKGKECEGGFWVSMLSFVLRRILQHQGCVSSWSIFTSNLSPYTTTLASSHQNLPWNLVTQTISCNYQHYISQK